MTLRLDLVSFDGELRPFEHAGPIVRIGRAPDCELRLDGDVDGPSTISWRHARIEIAPEGAVLTDLGSKNGTYVNDRRIDLSCRLNKGDRIRLGRNRLNLRVASFRLQGDAGSEVKPETIRPTWTAPVRRGAGAQSSNAPLPLPQSAPSPTRMMLVRLRSRHRGLFAAFAAAIVLAVSVGSLAVWEQQEREKSLRDSVTRTSDIAYQADTTAKIADTNARSAQEQATHIADNLPPSPAEAVRKVMHSTALIADGSPMGTGVLVDRNRRLLLTAYHVTAHSRNIAVLFAGFDADGRAIGDMGHYTRIRPVSGKIVLADPLHDLTLLELDFVPPSASAITIAERSAAEGETVHTIGNPAVSGAYFVANSGSVRQVVRKTARFGNQFVDAFKVEVQNPLNGGDSGGPLFNDRGELVGINSSVSEAFLDASGGRQPIHLVSDCIDVREVQALLRGFWR